MKNTNYFITGTDTGVGKTHVTAALLAELRRRGLPAHVKSAANFSLFDRCQCKFNF